MAVDAKRLLVIILFVSIFVMAAQEISDPDFFWHLRTGQLIWESRSIPRQDPFSYTVQGRSWIAHEWLTETIFFALYSLIGQRGLILVFLLSGVATLLNPHGWRILSYPFGTLGSQAMQAYIAEWFSPDFHQARFQPLALLVLLLFATLALSKLPADLTDMLLLLPFGYASLRSARHVPLFAVVAAPIIGKHLVPIWEGSWLQKRLSLKAQAGPNLRVCALNWFLLLLILCAGSFKAALSLKENESLQRQTFPVAAVDYLEGEERGNIYNLYHWGGYLIWRLYPEWQVFIDGRADVYGNAFIGEYLEVYQVRQGWRDILEKYEVELVLIDRDSALATLLDEDGDWRKTYEDEVAVIFAAQREKSLTGVFIPNRGFWRR